MGRTGLREDSLETFGVYNAGLSRPGPSICLSEISQLRVKIPAGIQHNGILEIVRKSQHIERLFLPPCVLSLAAEFIEEHHLILISKDLVQLGRLYIGPQ